MTDDVAQARSAMPNIAVIGTGVIGRSWIRVFARAGYPVRAWDRDASTLAASMAWVGRERHADDAARSHAPVACLTLDEALDGVEYVQESGPENLDVKRSIYAELDRLAPPHAVLGSSTSTLDMTRVADGLPGARRCIVAHPVNPPHVVPLVEVLGGEQTARETVERTVALLNAVGMRPVVLERYVPGFLLNRLQVALIREAVSLVERGVADVDAVDTVVRDGLGLRWAFFGPFGVANTNADGGIREYLTRFGGSLDALMRDLGETPTIDAALIERLGRGTDAMTNGTPREALRAWRDQLVSEIVRLKHDHPCP